MLAKYGAAPIVVGHRAVPGSGLWSRCGGRSGRKRPSGGNGCRGNGKSGLGAAGGALRQHLLDHRARLRGGPGKRLLQKRRGFCMTTTRKKQGTQIFRSLRRARIKLKRRRKAP